MGGYDDALADQDEAIRLKPDLAEAYANRGAAENALGLKDEAWKDFETVLELAGNAGNETRLPEFPADTDSRENSVTQFERIGDDERVHPGLGPHSVW